MTEEEHNAETDIHADYYVSDNDSGGAPTSIISVNRTLFGILPKNAQVALVIATYCVSVILGGALAVLAFWCEFQAQTHNMKFDMRDWMIGLICALLSLPVVGATIWGVQKK